MKELFEIAGIKDIDKALSLITEVNLREVDLTTKQIADKISAAFEKDFGSLRTSETENLSNKMYKLIVDKDFLDGKTPVARFRIPVITKANDLHNIHNSYEAFNKILDKFYNSLRNEGYLITQPKGGYIKGDTWEGNGTVGNIMTFFVAGKPE